MKTTLTIVFTVLAVSVFAQAKSTEGYTLQEEQKLYSQSSIEGTYQFRVSTKGKSVRLTDELCRLIVDNRKDNVDVTHRISEDVTLFIPSKSRINATNYEALKPVVLTK